MSTTGQIWARCLVTVEVEVGGYTPSQSFEVIRNNAIREAERKVQSKLTTRETRVVGCARVVGINCEYSQRMPGEVETPAVEP